MIYLSRGPVQANPDGQNPDHLQESRGKAWYRGSNSELWKNGADDRVDDSRELSNKFGLDCTLPGTTDFD